MVSNIKATNFFSGTDSEWRTTVEYGDSLNSYIEFGKQFQRRDCFDDLLDFIHSPISAEVCALFGLRRTGKTVLLYQLMSELNADATAYIKLSSNDDMLDLDSDLMKLLHLGFKNVLIDEITFVKDFASSSNLLADHFAMHGMKIILAGTDSLGIILAGKHVLYDRLKMIHTTFISFKEYDRLLSLGLDDYIQYGGTLLPEGKVPFKNTSDSTEYMNSAIVRNVQNALGILDTDPDFYTTLAKLYYEDKITGIVNRILDDTKHRFVERILNKEFKSSNLGGLTDRIRRMIRNGHIEAEKLLDFLAQNRKTIIDAYSKQLCIADEYRVSDSALTELKQYLFDLDVLSAYTVVDADFSKDTQYIFTQPGMQYSQATALVDICAKMPESSKLTTKELMVIKDFLLNNIKGRILEDIVINHVQRVLGAEHVFQFRFDGGEFDMIVLNDSDCSMTVYEIKHSSQCIAAQAKHLCNKLILAHLSEQYYKISNLCVLYTGEDCEKYVAIDESSKEYFFTEDHSVGTEVKYMNVCDFLCNL